jgi:DNA processing protein
MISLNELRYVLALQRTPNIGVTSARKLIRTIGSAEGVFRETKRNLLKIEGIGAYKLKGLNENTQLKQADEEIEFMIRNHASWIYYRDKEYPQHLKHCSDGPIVLFFKGNFDLCDRKTISIVGTRNATQYGRTLCEHLIEELAPLDPVVVSGFAFGIDIVAHRTAIKYGLQTIVCLAHGLNTIYPSIHKKYVQGILENGGLLTEFWSSDPFERNNFLKRNRIIAGMSQATVIIESGMKGGSLVTADIANSYSRDVFAFPGRCSDSLSSGCNHLIKTQQAQLITQAADIVYMLNWDLDPPSVNKPRQTEMFIELDDDERNIHNHLLEKGKDTLDGIALECDFSISRTVTLLFNLELKGLIRPKPGKRYEAI